MEQISVQSIVLYIRMPLTIQVGKYKNSGPSKETMPEMNSPAALPHPHLNVKFMPSLWAPPYRQTLL